MRAASDGGKTLSRRLASVVLLTVIAMAGIVAVVMLLPDEYSGTRQLDPIETWTQGPASGQWSWGRPVHTFLFRQSPEAISRALGLSKEDRAWLADVGMKGKPLQSGFVDSYALQVPGGNRAFLYSSGRGDYPWALEIPSDRRSFVAALEHKFERLFRSGE